MKSEFLVLANLLLCLFGGWVCLCRMTKMRGSTTKMIIRLQYAIWTAVFCASGISFLFGEPATWVQLLLGAGIVGHLALGVTVWRFGAPAYTMRHH